MRILVLDVDHTVEDDLSLRFGESPLRSALTGEPARARAVIVARVLAGGLARELLGANLSDWSLAALVCAVWIHCHRLETPFDVHIPSEQEFFQFLAIWEADCPIFPICLDRVFHIDLFLVLFEFRFSVRAIRLHIPK